MAKTTTKTTVEKPIIDFKIAKSKDGRSAAIVGGVFEETGQALTCYLPKVLLNRGRVRIDITGPADNATGRVRVYPK